MIKWTRCYVCKKTTRQVSADRKLFRGGMVRVSRQVNMTCLETVCNANVTAVPKMGNFVNNFL